ncbi:ribbon-helix-helix protein, CopG family [Halarsenatibacter silvermanii]|uniref:Ribbon-helix-helix protein, copG family n=1 Tax=Halarsenatibacter silvermanii TaxID=321763 RepID=A0A1G9RW76_9FIRM|nr:ribbon-helix-helix protein, CopG family [Halarsenatibacter silvermanii]SDM27481.1 Ribbon-helix-helix protein, copG family [Halarsenatibacter silvermanii]
MSEDKFSNKKSKGILDGIKEGPKSAEKKENDLAEKARKRNRVKRTYSLREDILEKLEELAKKHENINKSEIVEIALEELYEKYA